MSAEARIPQVGHYQLLEDFDARGASIRIIRMRYRTEEVESHFHRHSTQTYVALQGRVAISHDGYETVLEPYQALAVTPGTSHGARPLDEVAIVMNVSVPPLAADDQVSTPPPEPEDLRLPDPRDDLED